MSLSHYNNHYLINRLTFDSYVTMEGLDLAMAEDVLLMRTSRTATFTLSSSSSSSSSCSNLYNHQNGRTSRRTTICAPSSNSYVSENRPLQHSQSLRLNNQRRRPTIHNPYQLSKNLKVLNDWMIVSLHFFYFKKFSFCFDYTFCVDVFSYCVIYILIETQDNPSPHINM